MPVFQPAAMLLWIWRASTRLLLRLLRVGLENKLTSVIRQQCAKNFSYLLYYKHGLGLTLPGFVLGLSWACPGLGLGLVRAWSGLGLGMQVQSKVSKEPHTQKSIRKNIVLSNFCACDIASFILLFFLPDFTKGLAGLSKLNWLGPFHPAKPL